MMITEFYAPRCAYGLPLGMARRRVPAAQLSVVVLPAQGAVGAYTTYNDDDVRAVLHCTAPKPNPDKAVLPR